MKCLIVDDEPIARRGMKRLVERHPDIEIAAILGSAEEALDFLDDNNVDLIFLDIQMPGITGLEFARRIPGKAMVVFTTAYSEYAVEGYEVDAIDYLVKPIDPDRFDRAVDKARNYARLLASADDSREQPSVAAEYLIVKADRRFVRLHMADILFIEGLKDYVVIHLADRKVITRMTIKGMEELLPAADFIRVNKSYIANLAAIDSFDSNDLFIGRHEIAIGAAYRSSVLSRLLPQP